MENQNAETIIADLKKRVAAQDATITDLRNQLVGTQEALVCAHAELGYDDEPDWDEDFREQSDAAEAYEADCLMGFHP